MPRRPIATYAVAFAAVFGGYLSFRILYFGDVMPDTLHVKPLPSVDGA